MAGPSAAEVSITPAVCLTSPTVFLFISRTQIGKAISPQMRTQECTLPGEQLAVGSCSLKDSLGGCALLSTHLAGLGEGVLQVLPLKPEHAQGAVILTILKERC